MDLHELAPVGGRPRAGETGGGSRGSLRWVRIFRIGPSSVMNAISRISPPHAGPSSANFYAPALAGEGHHEPCAAARADRAGKSEAEAAALRTTKDVDILVRPTDLPAALIAAMTAAGSVRTVVDQRLGEVGALCRELLAE